MGTAACAEHYFFYNIKYDDEASVPRISGKKQVSSAEAVAVAVAINGRRRGGRPTNGCHVPTSGAM